MNADDLDALEALVRSGNAYGDSKTTLTLIADLRRAQECIDATKNMLGDEKRNPAMRKEGWR